MQVQAESFHLNGHIIRFRPQTQKLESPYKTPSSIPAVKGLTESNCGYQLLGLIRSLDSILLLKQKKNADQTKIFFEAKT